MCFFSPKPLSGILRGVRAMTVACMANSTLKCKLMGLQTAVTFCSEKKQNWKETAATCDFWWTIRLLRLWKTRRKDLVIRNKMTRPFQVWRFKFHSPLWYIFDHSGIPCGALGTQFSGVRPSSTASACHSEWARTITCMHAGWKCVHVDVGHSLSSV